MRLQLLAAAAIAAAGLASPAAAQGYGYYGYGPTPAYAAYGDDYASYAEEGDCGGGFTLAGARAGITVLGVNLDAGSGLRISAGDGRCGHHRHRRPEARADYAPPPPPPPPSYESDAPPAYGMAYPGPCGCAPAYGW